MIEKTRSSFGLLALLLLELSAGCGKYGPPYPPEKLSPKAVRFTEVKGTAQGVSFTWDAPQEDARGKPLRTLHGYRIYRKEVTKPSDAIDPDVPFDLVATVEDRSMAELQKKKEARRLANQPSERLEMSKAERLVSYLDPTPVRGRTYLYKVVPFNRRSVEGDYRELLKVVFAGDGTRVTSLESAKEDPSLVAGRDEGDLTTADDF